MSKPVIAVFGAPGAQGGGLARALKAHGAEVVLADLDDVSSVHRVLDGAYGALFVTNFREHLSAQKELAQAHNLAAAAAPADVRHVIWSTLEDTREFLAANKTRIPVAEAA
jgi:uncharacterized protein YbjT (DUF2867 family)